MSENSGGGDKFLFFLAGAGIGAVLALLFAPKSGRETRELIARTATDSKDFVTNKVAAGKDLVDDKRQKITDDFNSFLEKSKERHVILLQNDAHISAIFDADYGTVSAVFWDASGGTLFLGSGLPSDLGLATVSVNANVALILNFRTGTFTVSDPSQTLTSVEVQVTKNQDIPSTFIVELPQGGLAGSSITRQFLHFAFP